MEDIVFHPFLSALVSIYTVRIMILWCKSSRKKSRTQGGFRKFGVLILEFCTLDERNLPDLQDTGDNKLNSTWIKFFIQSFSSIDHFKAFYIDTFLSCVERNPWNLIPAWKATLGWHGALQSESLCWHWKETKTLEQVRMILDKTCCLLPPELDL